MAYEYAIGDTVFPLQFRTKKLIVYWHGSGANHGYHYAGLARSPKFLVAYRHEWISSARMVLTEKTIPEFDAHLRITRIGREHFENNVRMGEDFYS